MAHINPIIIAIRRKFPEEYFSNALLLIRERFFVQVARAEPLVDLISLGRKECRLFLKLQCRPEIRANTVRKRANLVPAP